MYQSTGLLSGSPDVSRSAQPILSVESIASGGFLLLIFAFWMLLHPYEGVVHDSILYAFATMARLHPDSLGHDIYLSVGVQDRYTLFSPLAAWVFRWVGLERGAALITLTAQISFFVAAWLLARRLMSRWTALLSVALLVALPPAYGDGHIFSYAESFMTARLPSEALVVGALAAVLGGRPLLALGCFFVAALLHPIMATSGLAMWLLLTVARARPWLFVGIAAAGFVALAAAASLVPFGPVARFDTGWFNLLYSRGAYLFPSHWALVDWAHASVPLVTLAIGAITNTGPRIRSVCLAALATGLSGLVISLVGSDLLHIEIVAQAQPWRWLWLSNALAVMLSPAIFAELWNSANVRRAASVLLAAAWVCIDAPYTLAIAAFAVLAVSFGGRITDPRRTRLIMVGSWLILGLGLLALVGFVHGVMQQLANIPPDTTLYDTPFLLQLRNWKTWQAGGVVPSCIILGAWWVTTRRKNLSSALGVLATAIVLCAAFAHFAWNAWTRIERPPRLHAEFAPWRDAIPQGAQVLWAVNASPVWFLLERPSYWSITQTAASIYSEPMARELARREWVLRAIDDSTRDPRQRMIRTCEANPALGYYILAEDAGYTPFQTIRNPKTGGSIRLYRCADYRG